MEGLVAGSVCSTSSIRWRDWLLVVFVLSAAPSGSTAIKLVLVSINNDFVWAYNYSKGGGPKLKIMRPKLKIMRSILKIVT